jgi:hypothetical protein
MAKYKLIKEYPGSHELGTIIIGSKETMYSKGLGFINYDWAHVETHPEFWEEVIENDYQILSYIKKGSTSCITTKKRGGELHEEFWDIHSIKRLSDGEVFTVGDKFDVVISCKDVIRTIKSIGIGVDGKILTIRHENGIITNTPIIGVFNKIKKAKPPVFLTHDGENIFEGDELWYVNKENLHLSWFVADSNHTFNSDRNAYFLTPIKARDYIRKNKECLSYNDVMEALNLNRWGVERLQELVNKKLGLQ